MNRLPIVLTSDGNESNQIKSNRNQIKSNQIESNQIKSNQIELKRHQFLGKFDCQSYCRRLYNLKDRHKCNYISS